MRTTFTAIWRSAGAFTALVGALIFASTSACGDSAGGAGGGCIAGSQESCACPGGVFGAQVCVPNGSGFGACMCGGATDSGSATDTDATGGGTDSPSTTTDPTNSTDSGPTCGDGLEEPGECNEGSAVYCPEDCPEPTGAGQTSTGAVVCDIFAGLVPDVASVWQSGASTGFEAGGLLCSGMGFDHVCDYRELEAAVLAEQLAALSIGTTLWVHRTTVELVGEENSGAELGGRCVDWTYAANELADGEFLEITAKGPVFNLDSDTFYDGLDPSHAAPGLLECGGVTRGIPCCNPACE